MDATGRSTNTPTASPQVKERQQAALGTDRAWQPREVCALSVYDYLAEPSGFGEAGAISRAACGDRDDGRRICAAPPAGTGSSTERNRQSARTRQRSVDIPRRHRTAARIATALPTCARTYKPHKFRDIQALTFAHGNDRLSLIPCVKSVV